MNSFCHKTIAIAVVLSGSSGLAGTPVVYLFKGVVSVHWNTEGKGGLKWVGTVV